MDDNIHFNNAPITEALLDIRVTLPQGITLESLDSIHEQIKTEYLIKEVKAQWETSFQIKPGESPIIMQNMGGPRGYIFYTNDKKKIFQAQIDGFTYNQLSKYESWEIFHSNAMRLWNIYKEVTKPISITRLALRYINRIEIPLPIENLGDYVKTVPTIIEDIAHKKTNYFMRAQISNTENTNKAIITNVIDEPPTGNVLPIILDIDVFREVNLSNSEDINDIFNSLREYKNSLFINNLTDKTKELIS